jgi:hypothetical protein
MGWDLARQGTKSLALAGKETRLANRPWRTRGTGVIAWAIEPATLRGIADQ